MIDFRAMIVAAREAEFAMQNFEEACRLTGRALLLFRRRRRTGHRHRGTRAWSRRFEHRA